MPRVPFDRLPDDARIWIFGASASLGGPEEAGLLAVVDRWLDEWRAHGEPLTCARDWREGRFLVIGVDQSGAAASGCSIDALFRALKDLESRSGTSLLGAGRVFFRDPDGVIRATDRAGFSALAGQGAVDGGTRVFDLALSVAADYRRAFERPASDAWHAALLN